MTHLTQTVFDENHYRELIEARGKTIRIVVPALKQQLGLSTGLDAGCGLGFFSEILRECGLTVRAFDGREENIREARRRYSEISFGTGDIEDSSILHLGEFDFVLCFGLLYHLENPLRAIRNLRALTGKALLLESMCFPSTDVFAALREEPSCEDQSLTDLAFYPSEGCIIKMLYRVGFAEVFRVNPLPDHEDFRETRDHQRKRTVLLAVSQLLNLDGFELLSEPAVTADPWRKTRSNSAALQHRIGRFLARSFGRR